MDHHPRSSLPRPLDPLVGRDEAVAEIARLAAGQRLVTLVGPAGCGKTRLAIAVGHRVEPTLSGGARLVDLTDITASTMDRLAGHVVDALELDRAPGVELPDLLSAGLATADRFVIFDNCEHLVEPAGQLIGYLLARVASLRVLVTSRQPLRVNGEVAWRVEPLPVPADGQDPADSPAVQLFGQRVFQLTGRPMAAADLPYAASVCRALDGLPLAIELAAGRVAVLSVRQIDALLADRFRLLGKAAPTHPSHHRTLRAALDWSYRLLAAGEQAMLRRLSVFRGGWTTEAADALCPPGAAADALCPPDALCPAGDLVNGLVDKSLVVAEVRPEPGQPARYRLLQSVAAYAAARLAEDPREAWTARAGHAGFYLGLAERAEVELRGPDQRDWLRRLLAEQDNLRAAMGWLATCPDRADDLRLAAALASYHHLTGRYAEGRRWLVEALARRPAAGTTERTKAYVGAAMLAMLECDYPAAADLAARGLTSARAEADLPEYGRLLGLLGGIEREQGQYDLARRHLIAARDHFRDRGDSWGAGRAAQMAGGAAWLSGDLDAATELLRESLSHFRDRADDESYASSITLLGGIAHYRGDRLTARANLSAALDRFAGLDFPEGIAWARNLLGLVELREGRIDQATEHLRASLGIHRRLGDRWRTASVLEALAEVARLRDEPERAAALIGAADAVRAAIGTPVPAVEAGDVRDTVGAVRSRLGDEQYDRQFARGRLAPVDDLLDGAPGPAVPGMTRGQERAECAGIREPAGHPGER